MMFNIAAITISIVVIGALIIITSMVLFLAKKKELASNLLDVGVVIVVFGAFLTLFVLLIYGMLEMWKL